MSMKGPEGTDEDIKSMEKHVSVSIFDETIDTKPAVSAKKRNSILTILLQNRKKNFSPTNGHVPLQKTASSPPYENHSSEDDSGHSATSHEQKSEPLSLDVIGLQNIHRKKSISTPTLPTIDLDNFNLSRTKSKTKYSTHLKKYQNDAIQVGEVTENNNIKEMRSRTMSDTTYRNQKTRKEKSSTSSMVHAASDNESFSRWSRKSTMKKSTKDRR